MNFEQIKGIKTDKFIGIKKAEVHKAHISKFTEAEIQTL